MSELSALFWGNALIIAGGVGATWLFVLGSILYVVPVALFVLGIVLLVRAFRQYQWLAFVELVKMMGVESGKQHSKR